MSSYAQQKASIKYDQAHTRQVKLKLNLTNDADIISKLDAVDNRQGYIKQLIRNDLKDSGEILSLEAMRILLQPVALRYELEKIYVFGSYARGDATRDSDIDLMIEGGNYRSLIDFVQLKDAFKQAFGKEVDVVEKQAVDSNNTRAGKRFRDHIERDKVLIYG